MEDGLKAVFVNTLQYST